MEILNKNSNFKYTVSWSFFLRSKLYTYLIISSGVLFISTQFIIPFYLIETQSDYKAPVENSVLGASTGFRDVQFDELRQEMREITRPAQVIVQGSLPVSQPGSEVIASNPAPEIPKYVKNFPENFYLKIPKLNIEKGMVKTNSFEMNPDNFIGHYAGSALPGEAGNVFLYGHSVVPFFFNPSNYKTIFSKIHELEDGDEFEIEYEGKTLKYKVFTKSILKPQEVKPLDPVTPAFLNEKTVSLMTCTPPGTTLKRLIVSAKQIE